MRVCCYLPLLLVKTGQADICEEEGALIGGLWKVPIALRERRVHKFTLMTGDISMS